MRKNLRILKVKRLEPQRDTLLGRKAEIDPEGGVGCSQGCRLDLEKRMEGYTLGKNPGNCLGEKRGVDRLLIGLPWQF